MGTLRVPGTTGTPTTGQGLFFNGTIWVPQTVLARLVADVPPSTSGNVLTSNGSTWTSAAAAGGKILQVVQTVDTTVRSTTSTSYVASGVSVTITPSATSSTILLIASALLGVSNASSIAEVAFFRGTTSLLTGSMTSHFNYKNVSSNDQFASAGGHLVDSPATASAVTYNLYFARTGSGTIYLGRRGSSTSILTPTVLTAMEIAA